MKILITGGAGYIGCELVYQLSKCSDVEKVTVYDNLTRENFNLFTTNMNKITSGNVSFVAADILDSRTLRKAVKEADVIYHLAARVTTPFSNVDSHFYEQVNNWGTAELIYAIEETNSTAKLIFLSSTSVYGGSDKKVVDETTEPNPKTFYATSKMRAEEHVRRLFKKMNAVIIRCGNVYGYTPAIRFDSVINKFMFEANFKNRISIHGTGKQARSFISVRKVVDTLAELRSKEIPSDVYNLTDKNIEILDLVDVLKEIYPPLEFIFINQHLELRDLRVNPETKLSKYYPLPESDIKEDLLKFKERFAFYSDIKVKA